MTKVRHLGSWMGEGDGLISFIAVRNDPAFSLGNYVSTGTETYRIVSRTDDGALDRVRAERADLPHRLAQAEDAAASRAAMQKPGDPPILQHFAYAHLPEHLRAVSQPWGDLARQVVDTLPNNAERSTALRKLLEGKDCAVRAKLEK